MSTRKTARSKTVQYETSKCIHCDEEVFIDEEKANIDNLPEGVNVAIGGGRHMNVDKTGAIARSKDYRVPKIIVKWFTGNGDGGRVKQQYLCPSCVKAIYGFKR